MATVPFLFFFEGKRDFFWHYNYCPSSSGQVLGCINFWGSLAVQAGVELCPSFNCKCHGCCQSLCTGWVSSVLANYFQQAPDEHFWQTEKQHSSKSGSNLHFHFVSSAWEKIQPRQMPSRSPFPMWCLVPQGKGWWELFQGHQKQDSFWIYLMEIHFRTGDLPTFVLISRAGDFWLSLHIVKYS